MYYMLLPYQTPSGNNVATGTSSLTFNSLNSLPTTSSGCEFVCRALRVCGTLPMGTCPVICYSTDSLIMLTIYRSAQSASLSRNLKWHYRNCNAYMTNLLCHIIRVDVIVVVIPNKVSIVVICAGLSDVYVIIQRTVRIMLLCYI